MMPRGGVYPHKRSNKIFYDPYFMIFNCIFLLRAFSIKLRQILGQFWNAARIESFGTTICCIIMNQNSNSRHGLLTPSSH